MMINLRSIAERYVLDEMTQASKEVDRGIKECDSAAALGMMGLIKQAYTVAIANPTPEVIEAIDRAETLLKDVARTVVAEYGRHQNNCGADSFNGTFYEKRCTCGLDALKI